MNWPLQQLRRMARIRNGSDHSEVVEPDGAFPVYGSGGEFARANRPLYEGPAVLLGRKGTIDKPLLVNGKFWTVDTMFCAKPLPNTEPRFLYYACTTIPFGMLSTSTALPSMTQGDLNAVRLPCPPFERQGLIADFLDRETAKIDALAAKQLQLIATLREDRRAQLINLVAHGCDASAPMKASGLGWVSEVPVHWTVLNIRRVAAMKTGHTPSRSVAAYWENTTIPWFTLADVWQLRDGRRTYLGETSDKISDLGLANSAAELLPEGTVVLSRTASVGFSGIMPGPMATSQDFWNWVCGPRLLPEYLTLTFRAMQSYFSALMMGSTHKTIYQADAASIRIPLPPLEEQEAIVSLAGTKAASIDVLIDKATDLITTMREYRSALITDAVTGKIDVQGAA